MDHWNVGYWHLCFTGSNVDELVKEIAAAGGKRRTHVFEFIPGTDRKLVYHEDSFGHAIEIFSRSYEQTFTNCLLAGITETPVMVERPQ